MNTRTTFSMDDGFTYHQTVTGDMKNGVDNFNYQKDLIFTGDANKFDLQTNLAGSFVPTVKIETSWQYDPIVLSLKTTLNDMSVEYTHTGPMNDFTCIWKIQKESETVDGTWSFKKADELVMSTEITCNQGNQFKFTFSADAMKGNMEITSKTASENVRYTGSYSRTASPFRYVSPLTIPSLLCHSTSMLITSVPFMIADIFHFSVQHATHSLLQLFQNFTFDVDVTCWLIAC